MVGGVTTRGKAGELRSRVLENVPSPLLVRRKKNVRNRLSAFFTFLPEGLFQLLFFLGSLLSCFEFTSTPLLFSALHSLAEFRPPNYLQAHRSSPRVPLSKPAPWLQTKRRRTPSSCRATRPLLPMTGLLRWTFIIRLSRNMTRSPRSFATVLRYVRPAVPPHPNP